MERNHLEDENDYKYDKDILKIWNRLLNTYNNFMKGFANNYFIQIFM